MSAPYVSLVLVSAAVLVYEILLTRLLAIIQWHHFAFMIISLALLGFGASGTFLALAQQRLLPRYAPVYVAQLALFGVSLVVCAGVAQRIPLNVEEILWDARQPLHLAGVYLVLALPFFFAANAIALCLARFRAGVARVYAANMIGSGAGSVLAIALLFVLVPDAALRATGALAVLASAVAVWELRLRPLPLGAAFVPLAVLVYWLPAAWTAPLVSPYKSLPQALQISGARLVAERSSPIGLISVVENDVIPWRHAPGLSLQATHEPPAQVALFTDGDAFTVITRPGAAREDLAYLDQMTSALPYHLRALRHVLVLGAGGGSDVLQARYHQVPRIDAVELDARLVELVRRDYREFSGGLYDAPGVRVHIAEARGFVARSVEQYDLIQLSLLDSVAAASAGLYALGESYLYTVEAIRDYLAHLAPDGYLALTRWVNLPPRDPLKLFATALAALEQHGVADPGARVALIRGWQTATLLVKNGVFTADELAALRVFCATRGFDPGYLPDLRADEGNRHNALDPDYFRDATRALLGPERSAFLERYKFSLEPATDDRPYFFHFFKWRNFGELLALRGQGGMALLEWSYVVLVATLAQALLIGIGLIVAPLLLKRRWLGTAPRELSLPRTLVFFFAVGLAYLLLEMAYIQRFTLYLGHPLYAVAVVLTAFLLCSGLGSAYAQRRAVQGTPRGAAAWAVAGIAALGVLYAVALGPLFDATLAWPVVARVGLTLALIAPLAFCMGLPFPLALHQVGACAPQVLPWAFGVNGCASVASAAGAMLLAMHFGFTAVIGVALALYGLAAFMFPGADLIRSRTDGGAALKVQ